MAFPGLYFCGIILIFWFMLNPSALCCDVHKCYYWKKASFVVIRKGEKHEILFYETQNVWDQAFSFIFFFNKETLAKSFH